MQIILVDDSCRRNGDREVPLTGRFRGVPRSHGLGDMGGLPGWIRVVGIAVIIAVLLAIVMMLAGGGHMPRGH